MTKLRMFDFSFGDTEDHGISCSASIAGENRKAAIKRLRQLLPATLDIDLGGIPLLHPDETITVNFNDSSVTDDDIIDDYELGGDALYPWTVSYRDGDSEDGDETFAFECQAENAAHAKEQCLNAYPDAIITGAVRR